jgi:serine 3-dehydrogenase
MLTADNNFILITGGSRGIGRGSALQLAAAGRDLVLWAQSGDELETVAEACRAFGSRVITATVNVADPDSVMTSGSRSLESLPGLRGVVLNAGIGVWNPFGAVTAEEWSRILSTNLDGAFLTMKIAMPLLIRQSFSQLIAMLSDSAAFGYAGRSAYCASKWGLRGLIEALRSELRPHGVRVTQIFLSRVDTHFRGKTPGGRPDSLTPDEVGAFIASIFAMPERMELRDVSLSSILSSYGPFAEVYNAAGEEIAP